MVPFVESFKFKDSYFHFKVHDDMIKRWTEHFTDFFYNPSVTEENVSSNLFQKDGIYEMMEHSSVDEIKQGIQYRRGTNS